MTYLHKYNGVCSFCEILFDAILTLGGKKNIEQPDIALHNKKQQKMWAKTISGISPSICATQ